MTVRIYHNPRCSKSRQTLDLLRTRGIEPEIIEYLTTPPDQTTLGSLLGLLGMEPRDLMRKNEPPYRDLGLARDNLDRDALISAMIEHPILIERPIVQSEKGAAVGRPPEAVLDIL